MAEDKLVFGKPAAGTLVHYAIQGEKMWPGNADAIGQYYARCDKQRIVLPFDDLGVVDVSCSKCRQYADHKARLAELERPDAPPPEEAQGEPDPKDTTDADAPEATPEKATDERAGSDDPANPDDAEVSDDPANPDDAEVSREPGPSGGGKAPLTEENYKEFMAGDGEKKPAELPTFVAKTGPKQKVYIVHTPTGQTLFNNVDPNVVDTAIKYLGNVKVKWENKGDPCPKDFIEKINQAFKAACKSMGVKNDIDPGIDRRKEKSTDEKIKEVLDAMTPTAKKGDKVTLINVTFVFNGEAWIPEIKTQKRSIKRRKALPETGQPKRRKIKRREKPKSRKIKRRSTRESKIAQRQTQKRDSVDKYGFGKDTIRSFITALIEQGGTFGDIAKKVSEKYDIPEARAKTKIKGLLRKYREKSIYITLIIREKPDLDYYHVAQAWPKS